MKVLLTWLREFAPLDASPEAIGEALGMLGTPVEEMRALGEPLEGIVVARVLELRQHPGAKKVQRVVLDAGDGTLEVWCGARNLSVGDLVPLATIGTVMPDGMEIARRRMLGEESEGMLCSPAELGLPGDAAGILILEPDVAPLGTPLQEAMGITADVLYDLEINPNRPDAMSVAGLARDLAAHFGVPFTLPRPGVAAAGPAIESIATVEVEDRVRCGRFTARVLQGVEVRPSPRWVAERLSQLGMRPINNVVDASNYVMLELGQPSHPYDLAALGGGGLRVRRSRVGERIVTLDGIERSLDEDDLLICDADDDPKGIAGIMGGSSSEIAATTTDVLVEVAWFEPMPIAKSARRLGLRSEASARFEKGCDPDMAELAHARYIEILGDAVGSVATGMLDARGELPDRAPVLVRTSRVNALLGTSLNGEEIGALLAPIGFASAPVGGDNEVTIPSWRYDSAVEIDVVEEVARTYGYDRIGAVVPPGVHFGTLSPRQLDRRHAREILVGLGLSEALPNPFLAPGDLRRSALPDDGLSIANPLIAEESVLRTCLLPGLIKTIASNESHRITGAALFELGHVFRRPDRPRPLPDEREHLAVAVAGAEAPEAVHLWEAFADALAIPDRTLRAAELPGLHPTRAAELVVNGAAVGQLGELDPAVLESFGVTERVAWFEVDLDALLRSPHGERPYRIVSKYPSSDVDLAFELDEGVPAEVVASAIRSAAGELLVDLALFDVYRGAGMASGARSLAYRLRLQALDHTLTDSEVGEARARCIEAGAAVGASLR
ncbi:MAG: phenylalanine--tRNA ligase subunit beta [Acidimicrobiales bacterium]